MERPRAMYQSQLLWGCMMPIRVFLTLLAPLCIPHAVLPHGRPVVPNSNDLQRESSPPDVAPTNSFMKLCHDTGTLIPTYTGEDRMGVAMSEQLSIHQGIPPRVPLNHLCICALCQEHTISKVTLVWCHPSFFCVDLPYIQRFLP